MKKGFTLIELLVVIAIIAILAAILFPVFARAREKARQASCSSNVKQICLGILMYVQDYDERFPSCWNGPQIPGDRGTTCLGWQHVIVPYIKNSQIFRCPSSPAANTWEYAPSPASLGYPWDYRYPMYGMVNERVVPAAALGAIAMPADTVMLLELYGDNVVYVPSYGWSIDNYRDSHNEGLNVGWCDGHVKWMKKVTLASGQGGNVNWYFDTWNK